MRVVTRCLLGAGLLCGVRGVTAQQSETKATQVPRQQIAKVLSQAMEGAPGESGGGLYDGTNFRIGTLRRTRPGEVEIHRRDTDIVYVLTGSATVTTDGAMTGGHQVSPDEERGTAIRDGVRHHLRAGDLLVIPKGVPHWFEAVTGEVSYVVVKVK